MASKLNVSHMMTACTLRSTAPVRLQPFVRVAPCNSCKCRVPYLVAKALPRSSVSSQRARFSIVRYHNVRRARVISLLKDYMGRAARTNGMQPRFRGDVRRTVSRRPKGRTVTVRCCSPRPAEPHQLKYDRRGTLALYAAANAKTGSGAWRDATRCTSERSWRFLSDTMRISRPGQEMYVIADNLSAYKTKRVQDFLQRPSDDAAPRHVHLLIMVARSRCDLRRSRATRSRANTTTRTPAWRVALR